MTNGLAWETSKTQSHSGHLELLGATNKQVWQVMWVQAATVGEMGGLWPQREQQQKSFPSFSDEFSGEK